MAGGGRVRILEAAYACVARSGLARTTVDATAREAGLSRATVYRWFPGGRDELLREVVAWEEGRFFARLAAAVADADGLEAVCREGLTFAHRAIEEHVVLQSVLRSEAQLLVPRLNEATNRLQPVVTAWLLPWVEAEHRGGRLRPGVEPARAADYVGRMLLQHVNAQGRWDLDDPGSVGELVGILLAGVLVTAGQPG
jgi:AcrR family transcriptional regulator